MFPEGNGTEERVSELVEMNMTFWSIPVADPIVKPLKVIVTFAIAANAPWEIVMTIEKDDGDDADPRAPSLT